MNMLRIVLSLGLAQHTFHDHHSNHAVQKKRKSNLFSTRLCKIVRSIVCANETATENL